MGVQVPPWVFSSTILHILLSVSPLALKGCSFLPRIPLGSGCLNVCIGVRLLGISVVWYICIYVYVIYRYMGIYCISYTNIFFFFGPFKFFPFRPPVPRDVPALRFLPCVVSSHWVRSPLIACFGVRRYSMRCGGCRGSDWLLLKWGYVPRCIG